MLVFRLHVPRSTENHIEYHPANFLPQFEGIYDVRMHMGYLSITATDP